MFSELTSDNIIDISMFIKDKGIGLLNDCTYLVNSFFNAKQFQVRLLRKAFFDENLIAYGTYDDEDISDLVLFDIKRDDHVNFSSVMLFNIDNTELLKLAVNKIFEDNLDILKIKLSTKQKILKSGFEKQLIEIGFEKEICNRKFMNSDQNIYTYSIFR